MASYFVRLERDLAYASGAIPAAWWAESIVVTTTVAVFLAGPATIAACWLITTAPSSPPRKYWGVLAVGLAVVAIHAMWLPVIDLSVLEAATEHFRPRPSETTHPNGVRIAQVALIVIAAASALIARRQSQPHDRSEDANEH